MSAIQTLLAFKKGFSELSLKNTYHVSATIKMSSLQLLQFLIWELVWPQITQRNWMLQICIFIVDRSGFNGLYQPQTNRTKTCSVPYKNTSNAHLTQNLIKIQKCVCPFFIHIHCSVRRCLELSTLVVEVKSLCYLEQEAIIKF